MTPKIKGNLGQKRPLMSLKVTGVKKKVFVLLGDPLYFQETCRGHYGWTPLPVVTSYNSTQVTSNLYDTIIICSI